MVRTHPLYLNYTAESLMSAFIVGLCLTAILVNVKLFFASTWMQKNRDIKAMIFTFIVLSIADLIQIVSYLIFFSLKMHYGVRYSDYNPDACRFMSPCISWGIKFSISILIFLMISRLTNLVINPNRTIRSKELYVKCYICCSLVISVILCSFKGSYLSLVSSESFKASNGFSFKNTFCETSNKRFEFIDFILNILFIIVCILFTVINIIRKGNLPLNIVRQEIIIRKIGEIAILGQALACVPIVIFQSYDKFNTDTFDQRIYFTIIEDLSYGLFIVSKIANGIIYYAFTTTFLSMDKKLEMSFKVLNQRSTSQPEKQKKLSSSSNHLKYFWNMKKC